MAEHSPIEPAQRSILYVCRHYTPATTAAGIRADHLVEALLARGLNVIVLTTGRTPCLEQPSAQLTICRLGDRGELPARIGQNHAQPTPWSGRRILPGPDADRRSARGFEQAGQWLIDNYQPRLLVVTGPPFYLMAVGQVLAGQNDIECVPEFRDAWVSGMYWPYRNRWQRTCACRWEGRCVEQAKKIITVTEAHRQILIKEYGREIEPKTTTIRHGFENGGHSPPCKTQPSKQTRDRFVIAYTGQLRGIDIASQNQLSRLAHQFAHLILRVSAGAQFCEKLYLDWMSPHRLMKALAQLIAENPHWADRIEMVFAGERFEQIDQWARAMNLDRNVRQLGPVSPDEANQLAQQADLLVLTLYGIRNTDYHWCVPSKLYQYLATGNPILALAPPGEARDLVLQAGVGLVADPDSVSAMATHILRVLNDREKGRESVKPDWSFINQFQLARQQKKFADLIEAVLC